MVEEKNEMQYSLARRLLGIMLQNDFISVEEFEKIDALNRQTFSPELAEVYV